MKLNRQSKSVLGIAGLFSALLLTNMQQPAEVHAISQSAPSQAVDTTGQQKQSTVILKSSQQVDAAAQVADAAFQLTNGHSNESEESTSNRSLGAIINDQALWAMTDESGSTSTRHVMKMPTSLDTDTAATWLTLAKKQGQIDQQKTGRQQQIIMVAATAQNTLEFAIGNTSVPHVDAVDVSSYQSWMTQAQYTQLKQLGVKTVIIKISESTNYSNPYAASQIKYAEAAGLNVAVYHFARFGNTATAQAEAKKTIQVLNSLGLPTSTLVFADMEGAETNVSSVGTNLNQYWKTMSAGGYMNHGVYTGGLYGAGYAAATSGTVGAARTWYAHYPTTPSKNNLLEKNYGAWQFSSTSYLPGFTGKFIDASTDYVGLFSKQYDQIISSKTLSGVMQIDQTNRKDGIYTSGPYNTSSATAAINTDGVKYNGQVVQELKQAVTPHSTYVQVKTTTGATFWIDIHALKTPTSDPVLESKSQDYYAVIDQSSRRDGVYLNGPYRTATGTYWPNTDGTKYDQQFVHVIKTERTKWSTYAQVVGDNNKTFWIDIHALKTPTYYPITSQKNVSYDVQIDESLHKNGVVDGIYESGPYRTSAETYRVNTDSKKYDGQYGHVDKEATNANSTYAHVKLLSGTSFWIDIHGLKKPSYDKILNQQNVDYDAKIDEAARPNGIVDGVYASGPYRTSLATSPINYDGKKYDQQNGHVDKLATTVNSTYAHIKLNSGTAFWIDVHALKKLTYDKILNSQNVNYDAKIDEAARPNGVVDGVYASGPYRTSLATSEINYDGKKYDQQNGHVDKLATTANSTYAHITLTSGTAFWIDVHALKKLSFDQVLKSQDVSYDAKIDELARPNGVVDGVYSSGPYRTSLATAAINYDGKKYDQQVGHVDKLATTVNSTYVHITLTTGTAFWIDSHAVQKLVYYPITSRKQVNYTAVIDESLHKNGVIDGIYTSGPYRTSLDTFEINTDSKLYDGQIVWVTEEATNAQSTYAHVTLTNGKRFWIDIHGLRR